MALKSDIKRAITDNTKFTAVKVWKPEITEYFSGEMTMTLEIDVRKKKKGSLKHSHINKTVSQAKELFAKLTDDERLEVMGDYCKHCGCDNPNCQCWNED